jgi:hypothetical protein
MGVARAGPAGDWQLGDKYRNRPMGDARPVFVIFPAHPKELYLHVDSRDTQGRHAHIYRDTQGRHAHI